MPEQIVYLTARGPEPLAAPTDIAAMRLRRSARVISVEAPEWHERALTMAVKVEASSLAEAVGLASGALAQGTMSVWRQFAVSDRPLTESPRAY